MSRTSLKNIPTKQETGRNAELSVKRPICLVHTDTYAISSLKEIARDYQVNAKKEFQKAINV